MSQTTQARPRPRLLTNAVLVALVATAVLGAVLSYRWFIDPSTESVETVGTADAVVVFAGSEARIETAMELMDRGVAPNLVIPNGRSGEIDDLVLSLVNEWAGTIAAMTVQRAC